MRVKSALLQTEQSSDESANQKEEGVDDDKSNTPLDLTVKEEVDHDWSPEKLIGTLWPPQPEERGGRGSVELISDFRTG